MMTTAFLLLAGAIVIMAVVTWWYAIRPMRTIARGVELLREQDFASRIAPVPANPWANHIVGLFNRMMDQLRAERLRLREQNHFLDLLVKASPMGVVLMDLDGHPTETNPAADSFLADPWLKKRIMDVPRGQTQVIQQNGRCILRVSHLTFMDRGFGHPFLLIESLSDEVRKAEREAYGRAIRMISHEVNNTLAGTVTILDLLQQSAPDNEQRNMLDTCSNRYRQMSRFVTRLADVVRIPEPTRQRVSVQDFVLAQQRFLETLCSGFGIRLDLDLCGRPVMTLMDTTLMEQVVINVVKNACESTPRGGNVRLCVSDNPASLRVVDHGCGIPPEEEQNLFTPFHSTKPGGQGIGLMLVQEVLSRHGFAFSLHSMGGETVFSVQF